MTQEEDDLERRVRKANQTWYDERAAEYDAQARGDDQPHARRHMEGLLARYAQLPPRARVLDIGTGTGFALEVASGALDSPRLVGLDVSHAMLLRARQRVPDASLVRFDGEAPPLAEGSFDLVLYSSVLHHLVRPLPLLRWGPRLLRPGGFLIVTQEPNPRVNGLLRAVRHRLGLLPEPQLQLVEYHQFHTNGLEPHRLVTALRTAGLRILRTAYTNASLVDELIPRVGPFGALLSPLLLLRESGSALSFSLVARRPW